MSSHRSTAKHRRPRNQGGRTMDPVQPHKPAEVPDAAQAAQNGATPPREAAEHQLSAEDVAAGYQPQPAAEAQGESEYAHAVRMAASALDDVGGLIARVDQIEAKLIRVDRQTLMLVGMVAVCIYGIKSLAGKVELDAAAQGL